MPDPASIAVSRLFTELRRADMRDIEAAIYAYFSTAQDAPFLLDADARAVHDALVELARYGDEDA